jgi:hypothetical protein
MISTAPFHFGNRSGSDHIMDMAVAADAVVLTVAIDNRAPNVFSFIRSNFYIHFLCQYQNAAAECQKRTLQ